MTATLTAAHTFTASPEDRRRCTCGKSRNTSVHGYDKTARAAAKLTAVQDRQEQVAQTAQDAEDAVAAVYARFAQNPDPRVTTVPAELAVIAERAAALDALPTEEDTQEAVVLPSGLTEGSPEADAAEAAESARLDAELGVTPAVAGWNNPHAKAPAVLPSQARKEARPAAPRGRKVEPNTRALWVARELVAIILDSTDPAHAVIVRKLSAVIPNNRGGRTIRLTEAEAELLSGIATEIETAVLSEDVEVDGAGRLARSCVTMRARLAALWA
jgi:hypothetical protein